MERFTIDWEMPMIRKAIQRSARLLMAVGALAIAVTLSAGCSGNGSFEVPSIGDGLTR